MPPHRTGLPPTVDAFSIRTVGNVVMLFIIDSVLHRAPSEDKSSRSAPRDRRVWLTSETDTELTVT